MRITLTTKVEQHYEQVWWRFDEHLFKALKPPLVPLKLLRYDGNKKGDEVHLKIGPFQQDWIALITEQGERPGEFYFIDEGKQLPFPLKKWTHHHRIVKATEGGTYIIDDFMYNTPTLLTDYLLYPFLYAQFAARRPIYKRYFAKKEQSDR